MSSAANHRWHLHVESVLNDQIYHLCYVDMHDSFYVTNGSYSKTCLKQLLKNKQNKGLKDKQ